MNRIITILFLSFLSLSCCRQKSKMVEKLPFQDNPELPQPLFRPKEIRIVCKLN